MPLRDRANRSKVVSRILLEKEAFDLFHVDEYGSQLGLLLFYCKYYWGVVMIWKSTFSIVITAMLGRI